MENNPFLWSLRFYSHYARVLMIKGDLGLRNYHTKPNKKENNTLNYNKIPFYHKSHVMGSYFSSFQVFPKQSSNDTMPFCFK